MNEFEWMANALATKQVDQLTEPFSWFFGVDVDPIDKIAVIASIWFENSTGRGLVRLSSVMDERSALRQRFPETFGGNGNGWPVRRAVDYLEAANLQLTQQVFTESRPGAKVRLAFDRYQHVFPAYTSGRARDVVRLVEPKAIGASLADLQFQIARGKFGCGLDNQLLRSAVSNAGLSMNPDGNALPVKMERNGPPIGAIMAIIYANMARIYGEHSMPRMTVPPAKPTGRVSLKALAEAAARERANRDALLDLRTHRDVEFGESGGSRWALDKTEMAQAAEEIRLAKLAREHKILAMASEETRLTKLAADIRELQRRGAV